MTSVPGPPPGTIGEVDRRRPQSLVSRRDRIARQSRDAPDARVVEQGVDKGTANPAVGAGDDDMGGRRE